MEGMERKRPRPGRSFTPEFKADLVKRCLAGDRSINNVAQDFDLTVSAVRGWVKQHEIDVGTRTDGRAPLKRKRSCRACVRRTVACGKM